MEVLNTELEPNKRVKGKFVNVSSAAIPINRFH